MLNLQSYQQVFYVVMALDLRSSVCSAGELDEAGNARPAFLMRLFDTSVSAGCHKDRGDGQSYAENPF